MSTIENIRNELIQKIKNIQNESLLNALDELVSNNEILTLSDAQKELLLLSEKDIENGQMISQEEMDQRNLKWLEEL